MKTSSTRTYKLLDISIRGRIRYALTGIRTPLGIKLYGNDHELLRRDNKNRTKTLKKYEGTLSVVSDKINSGFII